MEVQPLPPLHPLYLGRWAATEQFATVHAPRSLGEAGVTLVPNLLIVVASMRVDCASLPPRPAGPWLRGEYRAAPVVAARQRGMLARLGRRSLARVNLPLARAASGDSGIAPSKYYYLARAAYVGGTERPPAFLPGTSLSVDVDTGGIAYVTSFRLTREHGSSEAAVILVSDTALKGAVAACLAAE